MLLNKDGLTEAEFLAQYNPGDYKRPSVTTDILVLGMSAGFKNLKILLIRRGDHPFMHCWALPGGFIEDNETAFNAAKRELKEETGLEQAYLDQIYTFTKTGRDPRMWVMSIAYLALVSNLEDVNGMDDADDAAWFDLFFTEDKIVLRNEEKDVTIEYKLTTEQFKNSVLTYTNYIPVLVSKERLAFDHIEIIIEAMKKLRESIDYSDNLFCLMPAKFTMAELRATYQAVMNRDVYKTTLKRIVENKIEKTGCLRKSSVLNGRQSEEFTYTGGKQYE
ncbi:MAG: NUDIX hydrolase [Pseudobutyrivibrio sp.]|nr:NUDIX hydrolase [Pseudobutyrivibrio sp.]